MLKKTFAVTVVLTMLIMIALPTLAAPLPIEVFNGKPVVDGAKDELYNNTTTYSINNFKPGADQGATGTLNALWSDTTLYFYVEANDTTPFSDNTNADYLVDCVEFFFDINNKQQDNFNYDDKSYLQIRFDPGVPSRITGNNSGDGWAITPEVMDNIKIAFRNLNGKDLSGGYALEFSFDVKAFTKLKEGQVMPFEIQLADVSKGDGTVRDGMAYLGNSAKELLDTQWNTPTSCGALLTLKGAVPAPAAETEPEPAAEAEETTNPSTSDHDLIMFILAITSLCGFFIIKKTVNKA
jgi:hypothetical protein